MVLFLDDENVILGLYREMMSGQGIPFETTTNPHEALAKLREHPFTMVVTDQRMPVMTGTEFIPLAKEIRPEAKIFMVTATPPGQAESPLPANHVIRKPFDVLRMRRLIHQHAV